jgi:hypothetical protein
LFGFCSYSGQIYAEPHKSYESVTHAGASSISEADFSWACGVGLPLHEIPFVKATAPFIFLNPL